MKSFSAIALVFLVGTTPIATAGLEFTPSGGPPDAHVTSLSVGSYAGGLGGRSLVPFWGFADRERGLFDEGNGFVDLGCPDVRRIALVGFHTYLVDTSCGLKLVRGTSAQEAVTIPGLPTGALVTALFGLGPGNAVFIGTSNAGIFQFHATFEPTLQGSLGPDRDGLPIGASVLAISQAEGHIYASLATGGVFRKGDDGIWDDVSRGFPGAARVIALGGETEAWASIENGGLWRRASSGVWFRDPSFPDTVEVPSIVGAGGTVYAAAGRFGVLRRTDSGWQAETAGLPAAADVRVLTKVNAGDALFTQISDTLYIGTASNGVFSAPAIVRVRTLPAIVDATGAGGERWRTAVTVDGGPVIHLIQGGPPLSSAQVGVPYQTTSGGLSTTDIAAWLSAAGTPMPAGRAAESLSATYQFPFGAPAENVRLIARVYSSLPTGGTRGVALRDTSDLDAAEEEASVYGLRTTEGVERSNVAVAALPPFLTQRSRITLSLQVFSSDGMPAPRTLEKSLEPGEWSQWNDVLRLAGLPDGASGYARITRTAGTGSWTAYGVVNDDATGDGAVLPLHRPRGPCSSRHLLVPIVLDVHGAAGSHYTTELTLVNDAGVSDIAFLTFQASPRYGGSPDSSATIPVRLAAGEQRTISDVVGFLRAAGSEIPASASGDVAGTLHVKFRNFDWRSSRSVAALARTTSPSPDGSGRFGVAYPAVAWAEGARERATIWSIPSPAPSRTNIAVVNVGGGSGGPLVLSLPPDPGAAPGLPPPQVTLVPGEWYQANGVNTGVVRRVSGDDTFFAYGVMNDALTSDGTILPMLFVDR